MKKQTRVTHPKEIKLLDGNASVVPPVYRTVKFTYPTIAASLTPESKEHGFDYTRDSNPTTRELELLAAELQDRDDAIAVGSGMAAISFPMWWAAVRKVGSCRSFRTASRAEPAVRRSGKSWMAAPAATTRSAL